MARYFWIHSENIVSQKRLIFVINVIGDHYQSEFSSMNSNYRNGVLKIHKELSRDRIYVTFTQIKTFLNPNRIRSIDEIKDLFDLKISPNVVKIPFTAFIIFEKITDIILNNPALKEKCTNLFNKKEVNCYCRDNLVSEFYEAIDSKSDQLLGKQVNIYKKFYGICLKTCKSK